MFVNQPDDAQLVALWHDPETCPAIARRLGVSQTWLTLQWRRLRQQDRLPTDRRRNASERRVDEFSDGADGRPTIKTRDRLLKRLIAVHGEPRFGLFNSRGPTVSQLVDGVIYVALRSLKGSANFL
jgi:hypothetical protein